MSDYVAQLIRIMRANLLDELGKPYVVTARARGLSEARLIIKYPQWYDQFHERGYDVARQTAAFDRIWGGTETRDYTDKRWGGTVQYEAYFIMRWLGGIGGAKGATAMPAATAALTIVPSQPSCAKTMSAACAPSAAGSRCSAPASRSPSPSPSASPGSTARRPAANANMPR